MPILLNQTPQALFTVLRTRYSLAEAGRVWCEEKHSCYPDNVLISQDADSEHYIRCLAKLFFDQNSENPEPMIEWQFKQVYRILNAIIASVSILEDFKEYLITFREQFEALDQVKEWLDAIENRIDLPDVVCVGHGVARVEDRTAQFPEDTNTKVVTYAETGARILSDLTTKIENQRYNPENVSIEKTDNSLKMIQDSSFKLPQVSDKNSLRFIPNFIFTGEDDKNIPARVIEIETGRVLLEIKKDDDICFLNDIIKSFPNRKIHWAACSVLLSKAPERKEIGRSPHYNWTLQSKDDQRKQRRNENRNDRKHHPYARMFRPAKNDRHVPTVNDQNASINTSLSHSIAKTN